VLKTTCTSGSPGLSFVARSGLAGGGGGGCCGLAGGGLKPVIAFFSGRIAGGFAGAGAATGSATGFKAWKCAKTTKQIVAKIMPSMHDWMEHLLLRWRIAATRCGAARRRPRRVVRCRSCCGNLESELRFAQQPLEQAPRDRATCHERAGCALRRWLS
jgi:hypothetical protein